MILSALLGSTHAGATTLQALSLSDLVDEADLIVVGEAISSRSDFDERGRIITDHELRITGVWRGPATSSLRVRSLGGSVGETGMRVPGSATLQTGSRYLLFLRRGPGDNHLRCVGMSQGAFPIRGDASESEAMPAGRGAHLVHRSPQGRLVESPGALLHPEPLERLRARVQRIVQANSSR